MGLFDRFKRGVDDTGAEPEPRTDFSASLPAEFDVPEPVRLHLLFEGTVQGVGFRWTTQSLAREAKVTGWVRNLGDGRVEAELQGPGAAVCGVVRGIAAQYGNMAKRFSGWRLSMRVASCERVPLIDDDSEFDVRP